MSILQRLRQLWQPTTYVDPVFGTLRFQPQAGFWEGQILFAPENRVIEVLVEGDEQGPTDAQRDFYRALERQYQALLQPVGDLLYDTYYNWREELPRERIWEEFRLAAILVPNRTTPRAEWELAYECHSDDHSFDIQMRNWEPFGIAING
ncbi:MAG: hypothetical protein M3220_01505 [Chloroflexota bacterium]|nr:hypothetical protein [Chloroflexota bacterium]